MQCTTGFMAGYVSLRARERETLFNDYISSEGLPSIPHFHSILKGPAAVWHQTGVTVGEVYSVVIFSKKKRQSRTQTQIYVTMFIQANQAGRRNHLPV